MSTILRFPVRHVPTPSVSRPASLVKSLAVSSPPETATIRSTNPSDGVCFLASMRERDAFDAATRDARSSKLSPAFCLYDLSGWLLMAACYMDCNDFVNMPVTATVTTALLIRASMAGMTKTKQGQHFIRGWREKRGVSLRKLAATLPTGADGEPLVSYASLSRIETGEQPFSEPILNAIAEALNVPRAMLLEMDPKKEGHIVDLINQMDPKTRDQAIRMIELLARAPAA